MSDTLKKLRHTGQGSALALNVPAEAAPLVAEMTAAGTRVDRDPDGTYSFVIAFAPTMADAALLAEKAATAVDGDGLLWLCYPKGTSKRYPKPDLNRDSLWPVFEPYGFRPVAQVALDDDWSAMRFRRTEFVKK